MTTIETLTLVNIILTALTLTIAYFNYLHFRKKEFQEKLYQIKIDAYKDISRRCYDAYQELDVNSSPFVEIYDHKDKKAWEAHFLQEVTKMYKVGNSLEKHVYQYTIFIPNDLADKIYEYAGICTSYVTQFSHFDTGLNCHTHDKIWELYIDIIEAIRNDLKIEIIDRSLLKRITHKIT